MSYTRVLGNSGKMKTTEGQHPGTVFRNFSILAQPEVCKFCNFGKGCFTQHNRMAMSVQRQAYQENLEMVRDGTIWGRLDEEIGVLERRAAKNGAQVRIRVHDSGDYFSRAYLKDWLETAEAHPETIFYSYTKAVGWVKQAQDRGEVPDNYRFVFSMGTTQELLIDPTDRVAAIFGAERAVPPGWLDGSHDDFWASEPTGNIFLRYHGPKSKAFEALPSWLVVA